MKYSLQLPQACQEKWEEMNPAEKGRHCANCQKVVRDFSKMSQQEILREFQKSKGRICGRFHRSQIGEFSPAQETNWKKWFASGALLMVLGGSLKSQSPKTNGVSATEQTQVVSTPLAVANPHQRQNGKVFISGRVMALEHDMPLANVRVGVLDGAVLGNTDELGYFSVEAPAAKTDTINLIFSFNGQKLLGVSVPLIPEKDIYTLGILRLQPEEAVSVIEPMEVLMGVPAIYPEPVLARPSRIWHRIRRPFRRN